MPTFTTYFHPDYDMGARTNFRLPPRPLRPVIAALVCSRKGHDFTGHGTSDGSWRDEADYHVCGRCAIREFRFVATRERFDALMAAEVTRWEKILKEDQVTAA